MSNIPLYCHIHTIPPIPTTISSNVRLLTNTCTIGWGVGLCLEIILGSYSRRVLWYNGISSTQNPLGLCHWSLWVQWDPDWLILIDATCAYLLCDFFEDMNVDFSKLVHICSLFIWTQNRIIIWPKGADSAAQVLLNSYLNMYLSTSVHACISISNRLN